MDKIINRKIRRVIVIVFLFASAAVLLLFPHANTASANENVYTFTYRLIGQSYELGEKLKEVRIDTGELRVDSATVSNSNFRVLKGGSILQITKTSVENNEIILTMTESFAANSPNPDPKMTVTLLKDIGNISKDNITLVAADPKLVNPDIDIFNEHSVTYNKTTIPYRLFQPDGEGSVKAPLIVWINTAAETGDDGRFHIANVPVSNFTRKENQELFGDNGAYVIAPQVGAGWLTEWGSNRPKYIKTAIEDVIENNNIDTDRIYVCGGSLGGGLSLEMICAYPDYFAAAIPCATWTELRDNASDQAGITGANAEQKLAKVKVIARTGIPIYFVHATTDSMPTNHPEKSVKGWQDYVSVGGEGYLAMFSGVTVENNTSDVNHNSWLHLLRNFNGSEQQFINGNNTLALTGSNLSYTSTKPSDADGNNSDILSWMAAQTKSGGAKKALKKMHEDYSAKPSAMYTAASFSGLQTALNNVSPIISNTNAEYEQIKTARIALADAIDNLQLSTLTVTFKNGDEVVATKSVNYGTTLSDIPSVPTKTGHSSNWSITAFANITDNITVNAVHTLNIFTITFKNGEDVIVTKNVNYGGTLSDLPSVPTKKGYTGKWDVTDFSNITANATVNAVYTKNKGCNSTVTATSSISVLIALFGIMMLRKKV